MNSLIDLSSPLKDVNFPHKTFLKTVSRLAPPHVTCYLLEPSMLPRTGLEKYQPYCSRTLLRTVVD